MRLIFLPLTLCLTVAAQAQTVQKRTLDNGLTVLVQENHSAPVVAVRIYVKTGSIYEDKYLGAGLSHLFEHTLFEGTKNRTNKQIEGELEAIGGQENAYTSTDVTAYHITTAAPYFERALNVLGDMTQNATFPEAEVKVQQGVIHNEMNLDNDDAGIALEELFNATAFRVHPVRYPVIGFPAQFDRLTRDDILSYYHSHYTPENSVLSIAGDVAAPAVFAAVEREFGAWERQAPQALSLPTEPTQTSPRRAVIEKDVNQTYLQLGWHTIPLQNPDLYALDTLAEILGGNDSSRLVREIQEKRNLVSTISTASSTPNYDAGIFSVTAAMSPRNLPLVEAAIRAEVEKIKRSGVSGAELSRAKRQIRASFVFGKQGVENQAEQNALDEIGTGDPSYSSRYVTRIAAVTGAQIQAVARKYLLDDGLTTAVVRPRSPKPVLPSNAQVAAHLNRVNAYLSGYKKRHGGQAPATLAEVQRIGKIPSAILIDTTGQRFLYDAKSGEVSPSVYAAKKVGKAAPSKAPSPRVVTLANGLKLILRPNRSAATVSMVVEGMGGIRTESASQIGIAAVAAEMLTRGTAKRSEEQIAQLIDDLGGSMAGFSGYNAWGLSSNWLASDWRRGLNLMAESTLSPTFPAAELAKVKSQTLDALASQNDDPMTGASILLRKTFFGRHPYGRNPLGSAASLKKLDQAQLLAYWQRVLQPKSTVLAISGDFDSAAVEKVARMLFGSFGAKAAPLPAPPKVVAPPSFTLAQRAQPGLAQAVQWFGFPSVDIKDKDRFALDVLDAALSGANLPGGRLHARLRGDELVYVVHAYDSPGLDGGMFIIYAASTGANRARVRAEIEEELAKVRDADISPAELETAKTEMIASHAIDLQTNDAVARDLASNQLFGLGVGESARYAAKIGAITLEDVRRVANKYLRLDHAALAIVEPAAKAKS